MGRGKGEVEEGGWEEDVCRDKEKVAGHTESQSALVMTMDPCL